MKPTGSRLGILLNCGFPFNGQDWPEDSSGFAANMGTAFHWLAAKLINDGLECGIPDELHREALQRAGLDDSHLSKLHDLGAYKAVSGFGDARAEVAYAWDYRTGDARELGVDVGREYRISDTEIAGTADVVDRYRNNVIIIDWKTGEPPPARNNAQLLFLAMCEAKIRGYVSIEVQIRSVNERGVWIDSEPLTQFDLDVFEAQLVRAINEAKDAEPRPGAHCKWCPVRDTCPQTVGTITEEVEQYPLALRGVQDIQSAAHAEWLLHRVDAAEQLIGSIKAKVKEFADKEPIVLANGKKWGPYVCVRETIAGPVDKLIAAGVPQELIEYSVAKTAIEKHAKDNAEKGYGAAAARAAIERLRDAGCVRESQFTKYEARK